MAQAAKEQRLSRPHGDLPELKLHSIRLQRRADEVAFADRSPANRDEDVRGAPGARKGDQAFRRVLGDAEVHWLAAFCLYQGGTAGPARRNQLVYPKPANWT